VARGNQHLGPAAAFAVQTAEPATAPRVVAPDVSRRSRRVRLPRWAAPFLLLALCLCVYNANLRTIGAGDTLPARYLPLVLWHDGTFAFSGANARLVEHGHPLSERKGTAGTVAYLQPNAYWLIRTTHGQLASTYPIVAPLLVAPLYLPAVLWLDSQHWQQPQLDRVAELMEKISASLLASIASVLMFLLLRRERNPWALPLALAFAFGTDTWMISSQALWQHGSGELLVALALLLALARATPVRTAALGFVCVLIAANRQPDALIAGAFLLHAVLNRKRDFWWLLAGAALPLAGLLYYNLGFIGNLVGGYGLFPGKGERFFHANLLGLPGVLVSPTRGLLVFSPFLIFLPVGLSRRLRAPGTRTLAILLGLAVVAQLITYSSADWREGASWGPRWLCDLLPILVWMLAPAPGVLRTRTRGLLVALIVAAVGVQAIGAFWYQHTSDALILASKNMSAAWDPSNTPFIQELSHRPASSELLCNARGSIDRPPPVTAGAAAAPELNEGAAVQGWALACGHSPAQVILLIDGRVIGESTQFFVRPDVDRALHINADTGWSVTADTTGVPTGRQVLQLAVRVSPRSDIRIIREQPVTVTPPPSLSSLAALAVRRLRSDQARAGYWLTNFTSGTEYVSPQEEMNTYTTSVLVDLLAPVAHRLGLAGAVASAKRELAAQIESNGLVRYHGLPNGPGSRGGLGCVITPDADDTSLVWRIVGKASDPRLQPMLRTLAQYRDPDGLYRTWLSPVKSYQCIDPGRNPDPADLTINMHVYMMLHEFDRPAARTLCKALQRSANDPDLWVYYGKTAVVPYLRSAELGQLGCPMPLPTARLAQAVPGQQWWSSVARLLVEAGGSRLDADTRKTIRQVLADMAANDFAVVRGAPPLVFQNDPTANVPRYYWSADAGYALWLRLYEAVDGGAS
jgi:hypothetical protein